MCVSSKITVPKKVFFLIYICSSLVSLTSIQICKRFINQRVLEKGGTANVLMCFDVKGLVPYFFNSFGGTLLFMQYSLLIFSDRHLILVKELQSAELAFKETRVARISEHLNIGKPLMQPIYIEDMNIYWVTTLFCTPLFRSKRIQVFFHFYSLYIVGTPSILPREISPYY